jgi:DNA replication initiation complex subunit (GINS family)
MAPDEEVNYNRLVQIYQQEKKGGPPIHLEADFHDKVRNYLAMLKASYDQERSKDPSSMKALQLADQLQKVRVLQSDVLNLRLRKFLLLAHQTLTGGMVDTKNFTPEERELFEAMVAELCKGRNRIIDAGPGPMIPQGPFPAAQGQPTLPPGPLPTPQTRAICEGPAKAAERQKVAESLPSVIAPMAAEAPGPKKPTQPEGAASAAPIGQGQLVVVRILEDLPDFALGDRSGYSLKKKDVVALPKDIAAVLQAHGKAKPVQ